MIEPHWEQILLQLEAGELRAATQLADGSWEANVEVKQAILNAFKTGENREYDGVYQAFIDKHNLPARKFTIENQVRLVPGGSSVRRGAYVAPGVIIMPPAYINIGAYVDAGSMVDSHALVGSCAQIGKRVHLSAGVQIGGVLEPVGSAPVVVEDEAFIGAGAVLVEGVHVKARAIIAPGVVISKSVPIYDCVKEELLPKGHPIPEDAVVISGTRPVNNEWAKQQGLNMACPIIIKYRDEKTDQSLNFEEVLR